MTNSPSAWSDDMLGALFKNISSIGIEPDGEIYHRHRVILTNQIATIFELALLTRFFVNLLKEDFKAAVITLIVALLFSAVFLFNAKRRHVLARLYLLSLLVFTTYIIILSVDGISYGTFIGFYFIELNSLVVFLLLFDRNYDKRVLYDILLVIVILNIFVHDQVYFSVVKEGSQVLELAKSDSYVYFKLPQLTLSAVLLLGLHLWKRNFRIYLLSLQALHREVQEKNEEIMTQNEELTAQAEELGRKNDLLVKSREEVSYINSNLESLVKQRTALIEMQKEKLVEYAYYNAHKVRGPLARILGLLNLVKIDRETDVEYLHDLIYKSALELDEIIKEINTSVAPYNFDGERDKFEDTMP